MLLLLIFEFRVFTVDNGAKVAEIFRYAKLSENETDKFYKILLIMRVGSVLDDGIVEGLQGGGGAGGEEGDVGLLGGNRLRINRIEQAFGGHDADKAGGDGGGGIDEADFTA